MKKKIGWYIIASALVWGGVIVACALTLKSTPYKEEVSRILSIGTSVHLILIWGPVVAMMNKKDDEKM